MVHAEVYDGPLDLLVDLVRRDGIDPRSLPLVEITRAYLSALEAMGFADLDVAGEFLVMAATLCELKSRELLPRSLPIPSDDEDDPREALARRILEFQRFRQAAEELGRRNLLGRDVFGRRPTEQDARDRPVDPGVAALGLLEIWDALERRHAQPPPVFEVERERVSWLECLRGVLAALDDGETRTLDEILLPLASRSTRIVSFLAVLELCRVQVLEIEQRRHLAPVLLRSRVRADAVDLSLFAEAS
ncbi:MAG: segregation/condensation protein A [Deltaproteobacteria bacterium]|nr:segregation/condensation protein A [Deltaproteobacteria bacterium]